ncbi:MAG TPA: PfkB family carbohydrate kinase [Nitrososphaeraceae archaeon]|jgi:sugar/nucleoside kinase (ribokinase family)|nr:PfkB family carbohydrate kinase [Nitrososphaeraceae archaeon]
MLAVFGTIALDTTRTPFAIQSKILGGAATFASLSSSFFTQTSIIGIVGSDFPAEYRKILDKRMDTRGIVRNDNGRCFHYDSTFDYDLAHRTTNKTELNVIADFNPAPPSEYIDTDYLYLANNDPVQNMKLLEHFSNPKLTVCDTIEYWILYRRDEVIKMMRQVNGVIINQEEARLLCKEHNLIKCAKYIMSLGPEFTVIKKGENGALLFFEDLIFPAPAYPLDVVVDPTGAGDSFAGGFMGYIAQQKKKTTNVMKEAVIYGNVMGAFAVQDFGVSALLSLSKSDIQNRYEQYRSMISFG